MTVIVGIVDGSVVVMGADSNSSCDDCVLTRKDEKIFRLHTKDGIEMLVGFAGEFSHAQKVRYLFRPPTFGSMGLEDSDLMRYFVTKFVPEIKKQLKFEKEDDITLLVGFKANLFTIHHNGDVEQSVHPYAAIGSGAQTALGSLFSSPPVPSWEKVDWALRAASEFCASIRGPYVTEVLFR